MLVIHKIKPKFNYLVTTMDVYDKDIKENGVIVNQKGTLKEWQKVIAVGPMVKDIQEGDLVVIDPTRYAVTKFNKNSIKKDIEGYNAVVRYNFKTVKIEDKEYLYLVDSDIMYTFEGEEVEDKEEPSNTVNLILPDNKIHI